MGSTKWLKVDLDLLHEGLLAARQAHEAIAASAAGYEGLSTAVGHRRLNTTLDDFGRNWAVHRRRLLDELDTLAGNISHTYEKFRRDDENMGRIDGSPKRPVERPAHNGSTSPATPGAAESAEQAEETADYVRAQGGEAVVLTSDLTVPENVEQLFAGTACALGSIDVAVNTVGKVLRKPIVETSEDEYDAMF